ncbi:MAG: heme exporter protein CcmB [Pseudomonadales bacterium]|nr:heme exporter protein CcmB [Pseudomonadales bacterium]
MIGRELLIAARYPAEVLNPLVFFLMVVTLFPLGISPEPEFLAKIAGPVIWIAALLAMMLSLDSLFKNDFDDGSLAQLLITPSPLAVLILVKVLTHWFTTVFPIILLAPLLGAMLQLPAEGYRALLLTLLLGTPIISLIGAIGAALTVGLHRGGVLLSLIVLPLFIPILVFGTGAIEAATLAMQYNGQLAMLSAMLLIALLVTPIATAAALKISINN